MKQIRRFYHYCQRLLAKYYFKLYPKIEVIGITGSVGKTTTKEMMVTILREKFKVLATKGNIDPIYNIPLTIFRLKPGIQKMVVELSVDHFGDMDKYFWMIKPKVGVFTPIYWTHTEFLGNISGVIKEKGKLAEILSKDGVLILNKEDKNSEAIAKKTKTKIIYYGLSRNCDLYAEDLKLDSLEGVEFTMVDKLTKEKTAVKLTLLGKQNVFCALAAASVGKIYGLTLDQIKKGLEKIKPLPQRMNLISLGNHNFLIDDSYNSSPLAVKMALETLKTLKIKGKRIAVLGEMKELGDYSIIGHKEIGKSLVDNNFEVLISFGELTKYTAKEAKKLSQKINVYQAQTIEEIVKILKKILDKNDIVLLKGSRFSHMERIYLGLLGNNHCEVVTCKEYKNCKECEKIVL